MPTDGPEEGESAPQLQPQDLEDIGNIFDRIRVMNKKRTENNNGQNSKKLIIKNTVQKMDDLAIEFDKQLSEMMQNLAHSLKDELKT